MGASPPPDPTPRDRKRLIGVGVLLAFLVVLLLLVLRVLGLWGGGKTPAAARPTQEATPLPCSH
jgi:hypothetical protein